MSLFKLKSLWAQGYRDEEFDQRHLAVGKIGRSPALALGNFQGTLRVYLVSRGEEIGVRSIYQNSFDSGIVDVKFVSHPDDRIRHNTIGVLFFRKFAYLHFQPSGEGFQVSPLFIDVSPSFGISPAPVAVMTLNSTVQYLNPLEEQRIKVADPIYPFARSMEKLYFVDGEELVEVEGSTEQWRIIVGRVRQLFVFLETVVVVGERALWEVSNAKILKTKVMEEEIACGSIAFRGVSAYNILVGNFSGQLFIYSSDYTLLWAMSLDFTPLHIVVCQHEEVKGMMVLLSEEGNLELAYSGVDIPENVIEPLSEEIDYALVASETAQFMQKMKANPEQEVKLSKKEEKAEKKTGYRVYFGPVEKSYEPLDEKDRLYQSEGRLVKAQLVCEVTSPETLRNLKVQLSLPYNLFSRDSSKEAGVARRGDKVIFNLYASNESFPYEKELSLVVRYQNNDLRGAPFLQTERVAIPMGLQCHIGGFEVKENYENKLILKSNTELPSFNDLFGELVGDSPQQRKSMQVVLANQMDCVVTYNKGFNKAKVASPTYSGLCYVVNEFTSHVRAYNQRRPDHRIELSVEIPLEEFFHIMKEHHEQRERLRADFAEVEQRRAEFRGAQKQLLLKMKEKMSGVGSIEVLLDFTYERLMASAARYEQTSARMEVVSHNLCVAVTLIIELLFIRSTPSPRAKQTARGILGYEEESLEVGWEEKVMANSAHFLNKKHSKDSRVSFEQLQKIPLFVISKVNNGDWN